MTTVIDPATTLAEIVTDHPDLARELERRSLDYCCGGHRTLADACARDGLDVDATASDARPPPAPRPGALGRPTGRASSSTTSRRPTTPTSTTSCPRLTALADKVAGVHGARHPELLEVQPPLRSSCAASSSPTWPRRSGCCSP